MAHITQLINLANTGDEDATNVLFERVYEDLRLLASSRLRNEPQGQTLQPTALVHETYLRLFGFRSDRSEIVWESRGHFFAAAAEAMRRILIEVARSKKRLKRGGGIARQIVDIESITEPELSDELLLLNDALDALSVVEPSAAKLVMLRYFGGLTLKEAAATMRISPRTADSYWAYARAWLLTEIQKMQAGE